MNGSDPDDAEVCQTIGCKDRATYAEPLPRSYVLRCEEHAANGAIPIEEAQL